MHQSSLQAACRFAVGVGILAIVTHTWFLMGLVVPVTVAGSSMSPTLDESQRTFIDRTAYAFRGPHRWEIVVFRSPDDVRQLSVKRVVGLPGESVSSVNGEIRIDGHSIENPHGTIYEARPGDQLNALESYRLGPHEYFVLGDNADVSDDSRNWPSGPGVDEKLLVGRPLGVR